LELEQALSLIRPVPDFPLPGILFQDINPLLAVDHAFAAVIAAMAKVPSQATVVAGIEARGFILGSALAQSTSRGFLPVRKIGKLPGKTLQKNYHLEYGRDGLEIPDSLIPSGTKIVLVDDVLATGGTVEAALSLLAQAGLIVSELIVLLEITSLGGREALSKTFPAIHIHSLIDI
jgi:adenine phosphoribosyltransferase